MTSDEESIAMSEPARLPVATGSAWAADEITAFLDETRVPIRLACNDAGVPRVCSLWFRHDRGTLWCAVQRDSKVARLLAADGRCGFEIAPDAPPYRGVRGQGVARLVAAEGGAQLERLMDRYLGDRNPSLRSWLTKRSASETAIRIEPDWVSAWDYRERMESSRPDAMGTSSESGISR